MNSQRTVVGPEKRVAVHLCIDKTDSMNLASLFGRFCRLHLFILGLNNNERLERATRILKIHNGLSQF